MKINLILYTVALSFFCMLFGCKKNESLIRQAPLSKLEAILAMTGDDQLTSFNMLSGEEKVAVHALHINKYVARKSFNPSQLALIREFLQFNKSEYYDIRSDARESAITYFASNWLDRAKNSFSNNEIYTIAFSLDDIELRLDRLSHQSLANSSQEDSMNQMNPDRSPYNNESLSNCYCNVGSSYTCPRFSLSYNTETKAGISVGYNPCSYLYLQPCDTEGGCGFGGWSICDGNKCT